MENFNLRLFDKTDLIEVDHINRICLPENYSQSFFLDLYHRFPKTFIVASADNTIVGYAMCRIETSFSGIRGFSLTRKGHLISIAVLPEYQGKGIGQALLSQVLEGMMEYNAQECYLEVRVSNQQAINLYNKLSFETKKVIKGYYRNGESAYLMSLSLSERSH